MEHKEILSQGRYKVGDSGKDYWSRFAADWFVINTFVSNWASIAIRNVWGLLVLKVWGIITLDGFLIQNIAEIFHASSEFMDWLSSDWIICYYFAALPKSGRLHFTFTFFGVNNIKSMLYIEFSKPLRNINPSVEKEDIANIDIVTLFLRLYLLYWKEKRNAYFEFRNAGFMLKTLFFLISAIYTY